MNLILTSWFSTYFKWTLVIKSVNLERTKFRFSVVFTVQIQY